MRTKIYKMSLAYRAMAIQGLVPSVLMAGVTTYAALFARPADPNQMLPLLLCLVFGYAAIGFFLWLRARPQHHIEVTDEGIAECWPGKTPVFLTWSEIGSIKASHLAQRLELRSAQSDKRILIDYQVEKFLELKQLIEQRTRGPLQ